MMTMREILWVTPIGVALLSAGCATHGVKTDSGCQARQLVQIEIQTIEIDDAAISIVGKSPVFTPASISSLVANKQAKQTSLQVLTAPIGQEGMIKGVSELIYPTEFTSFQQESGNRNTTVTTTVATGAAVEPGGFEMREVGLILQTVPEIRKTGEIALMLNPQWVSDPQWISYGNSDPSSAANPSNAPMRQPIFDVLSVSTTVLLRDGEPMVLGACPNKHDNKTTVILVCAHLIN